jgi:hypothetical protein
MWCPEARPIDQVKGLLDFNDSVLHQWATGKVPRNLSGKRKELLQKLGALRQPALAEAVASGLSKAEAVHLFDQLQSACLPVQHAGDSLAGSWNQHRIRTALKKNKKPWKADPRMIEACLREQDKHAGYALRLLDRLQKCVSVAATEHERPKHAPIRVEGRQVFVEGEPVPLGMTPDKAADALAFLKQLLREPGNWQSSAEIGEATKREGVRFDRTCKNLPAKIRHFIQSSTRKGFRIHWRN